MKPALLILAFLLLGGTAEGQSKKHKVLTALEHLALGAGTEVAVSQAAGGPQKYQAGLLASGIVAGFKEGADAVAGRDTKKQAFLHAITIIGGAGIAALAYHKK